MCKKFYAMQNKDAGEAYVQALIEAGYEQVKRLGDADFALIDLLRDRDRYDAVATFFETHPVFVYPHTPLSYFIWDGHYKPVPASCTFVAGKAAKKSLESYGYPGRIEICGFSRCHVREFTPTRGSKLLFVPARVRWDGSYSNDAYAENTPKAWAFVLANLDKFEQVRVCYVNYFVDEIDYLASGIEFFKTAPRSSQSPTLDMLEHISWADLVMSCETVGCLSVAVGKPTVFYNARAVPATGNIPAANYEKYRKYYEFPLTIEEMGVRDILDVRGSQNSAVELWKRNNIGKQFDRDKFLRVVQEYVA